MLAAGPEQQKEPRYQVTYHTYQASRRRLSCTLSIEHVLCSKYTKHSLLVLQIFAIVLLLHAHVRIALYSGHVGGEKWPGMNCLCMCGHSAILS